MLNIQYKNLHYCNFREEIIIGLKNVLVELFF